MNATTSPGLFDFIRDFFADAPGIAIFDPAIFAEAIHESPREILRKAKKVFAGKYPAEEIRRTLELFLRRFFTQQFKRSCSPDGPAVSPLSLSPRSGWRVPSDASPSLWLDDLK